MRGTDWDLQKLRKVQSEGTGCLSDNPSKGVTFVILVPIVFTIFQPPDMVPSEIAVKQENATQSGKSEILFIPIPNPSEWAAIRAAAIIPITFWESFNPCPILNKAEDTSWSFLNHTSAV